MWIRDKTQRFWWLSYMILVLLGFIGGAIIFTHSFRLMEMETEREYKASLDRFSGYMDSMLGDMRSVVLSLAMNEQVTKLLELDGPILTPEEMLLMYYCQNLLVSKVSADSNLQFVLVSFPEAEIAVSTHMIYREKDIGILEKDIGVDPEMLMTFGQPAKNSSNFIPSENSLLYVHSFFVRGRSMIIAVKMQKNGIDKETSTYRPDESAMLVNMDGGLFQVGKLADMFPDVTEQVFEDSNDEELRILYNGSIAAVQKKSSYFDIDYALAVSTGVYYQKLINMRTTFIIYSVCLILLGSGLALYFANRNYRPIKRVAGVLLAHASKIEGEDGLGLIERKVGEFLSELNETQKQLFQTEKMYREELLKRLIMGRVLGLSEIDFTSRNIKLGQRMAIAAIRAESYGDLLKDASVEGTSESELVHFTIMNVVEELVGKTCPCSAVVFDDVIYCIASLDMASLTDLADSVRQAILFFNSNLHVELTAGISREYNSYLQLGDASLEALAILEYQSMTSAPSIATAQEIIPNDGRNQGESLFLERAWVINSRTAAGEYDEALAVALAIAVSPGDAKILRSRISALSFIIIDSVEKLGVIPSEGTDALQAELKKLSSVQSLKDFREGAELVYAILSDLAHGRSDDRTTEIIEYIEAHYSDQMLSISGIADDLNISQSTVTRLVRQETGRNPLDYIQMLRLKKAKALLSGGLTISEVASSVGCYNDLALKRIFKKFEGITPAVFRESSRQKVLNNRKAEEII